MIQAHLVGYEYLYIEGKAENKNTLLLLHGTGGDEHELINLGKKIDPDAHILSLRGNVSENGFNRFFERFAEGVFNEEDIKKRSHDLAQFVIEARKKHQLEPTEIIAVGYSNGANIAAAMMLLEPCVLDGALLFRALLPLQPENDHDLSDTTILLLNGTHDTMIDPDKAKKLAKLFEKRGANVTQIWFDASHTLTHDDFNHAESWYAHTFI